MINSIARAFQLGRVLPIVFWGILSALGIYFWTVLPDFGTANKVLTVVDVILFLLNVLARLVAYFSRKVAG